MGAGAVLGLDIGGSKTHGVRRDSGGGTVQALGGSANIRSVDPQEAAAQLDLILEELGTVDVRAVCAGAAGGDSPATLARIRELLAARLPSVPITVVHDTRLILAAAGLDEGVAVISGTGSVSWARRADGEQARAGGWGYLLGDEGSGYRVAIRAVRHALTLADRGEPADQLARALTRECGLQDPGDLLDHVYARPQRRYWADRAGTVFRLAERGDPPSRAIVAEAARALSDLATTVAARLDTAGPVVLAGGLATNQPQLCDDVRSLLRSRGLHDVRVLDTDPVHGAVLLAEQLRTTDALRPTSRGAR